MPLQQLYGDNNTLISTFYNNNNNNNNCIVASANDCLQSEPITGKIVCADSGSKSCCRSDFGGLYALPSALCSLL